MSLPRPLTIGVTALLALGAAATGAAAQVTPVDVTAAVNAGSRQFFVEDLAGAALTKLELGTSGQGQPFQTRVKDDNFTTPSAPFTASAEMTNLYKTGPTGTFDYATKVASEKLSVSYAGVPTDIAGVSLGAVPTIQVAGLLPKCDQLKTLLPTGSSLLDTGGLLGGVLGTLGLSDAAVPLCDALGGAAATTALPVAATDKVLVTLDEKVIQPALGVAAQLPVSGVTGSTEAGNFANPSFLGAAGAPGQTATAATTRTLLAGTANSGLDLNALVSPLINGLSLFPAVPGGTGALTSVSAVVAALQNSVTPAISTVGTKLAGLTAADQTGVLSGLTGATSGAAVATLADTVLRRISGTYRSFPRLTADLTGAPTGTYTGTMTVTFVQQ